MGTLLRKSSLVRSLTHLSRTTTTSLLPSHHVPSTPPKPSSSPPPPLSSSNTHFSSFPSFHRHSFSSSSTGATNIVIIDTEEQMRNSVNKAQNGALPSIFYFTAVWCGPCRSISPIIEDLSRKYPHVTTYKIDIDLEALGNILNKLNISAVPTFHFFNNGKKAAEVVGADAGKIKETVEKLYKQTI